MASKSKAQRAFLIKVVADSDFAKSRKMSQDVARDILNEDEEHIAKDKHWADKLPDRAGSHSMECRNTWWDPEMIPLLVEQQVHPSFESLSDKFRAMLDTALGKKRPNTTVASVQPPRIDYDLLYAKSDRVVKTGTDNFSALAAQLRMKQTPTPFWPNLIRQLDEYAKMYEKYLTAVVKYTKDCERIYKRCESMKPEQAAGYAWSEMKKLGPRAPAKPNFPLGDFEYTDNKYGETHGHAVAIQLRGMVVCEYPTQAQLNQLQAIGARLLEADDPYDDYWTLDDTDELKWWDHHFPGQENYWGPMLNHFPIAGSVPGFDAGALEKSGRTVTDGIVAIVERVTTPKATAQ